MPQRLTSGNRAEELDAAAAAAVLRGGGENIDLNPSAFRKSARHVHEHTQLQQAVDTSFFSLSLSRCPAPALFCRAYRQSKLRARLCNWC